MRVLKIEIDDRAEALAKSKGMTVEDLIRAALGGTAAPTQAKGATRIDPSAKAAPTSDEEPKSLHEREEEEVEEAAKSGDAKQAPNAVNPLTSGGAKRKNDLRAWASKMDPENPDGEPTKKPDARTRAATRASARAARRNRMH